MSTFAERFREVFHEQGWTQQSLAEKVGDVSQTAVGNWLSGKVEPYPSNLARLCIAMGVRRDWLLYGEGRKMMRPHPGRAPATTVREEEGDEDTRGFLSKVIFLRQLASREQREMLDAFIDALEKVIHLPPRRAESPSHYENHVFETTKPVKTATPPPPKKKTVRYSKARRAAESKAALAGASQNLPGAAPRGTQGPD